MVVWYHNESVQLCLKLFDDLHIYIYIYSFIYLWWPSYICIHTYIHTYIYIYIYICACVCTNVEIWINKLYIFVCIFHIHCYVLLFDDPDRTPDEMQTWIEVMASASDLGATQRLRAAQRLAGTDHVIWVMAAGSEKLWGSKHRRSRT